ncbi:MAG: aquaporin [Candidatus Peribacteria bacterium]|nr:MAG: aquaporin [Candidatus Peribacteria bacterium]
MKKLLVEFLGTFFLVLVIALSGNPFAIGSILAVMVYMGGGISGAHYNPAVSLGIFAVGQLSRKRLLGYWLRQLLGAFAAAALALWITGVGLIPVPASWVSLPVALVVEAVFTFALVLVVLEVAVNPANSGNQYYGFAI